MCIRDSLGPIQLDNQIEQDETISAELDAINVTGSRITKERQIIPRKNTVLYVETAREIGYIDAPENMFIDIDMIKNYTDDQLVIITTGSQGETMSALTRMAAGEHKKVVITPNDMVIISATPIPGNEKLVSDVYKRQVEYKHTSKKSVIVQKEIGPGRDCLTFSDGVKNSLREDCDILVIGEIRDRETMEAAIETAESGHLVIGTLHTKSCAETIDRMVNFYEIRDQQTVKFLIASLLKLVIAQRLLPSKKGDLVLVPEVMVVDNMISGIIRKEKISVSEIEDAIQRNLEKGSIGLINSIAELFVDDVITLEQASTNRRKEYRNVE